MADLERAWNDALESLDVEPQAGETCFAALLARYDGAGRVYHNRTHLDRLIGIVSRLDDEGVLDCKPRLTLGLFYHDAVYHIGPVVTDADGQSNEKRSASLAETELTQLGVAPADIDWIRGFVLATEDHFAPAGDKDTQFGLDADLSILGAPADEYSVYAEAIRSEWQWMPECEYARRRSELLAEFLKKAQAGYLFHMSEYFATEAAQAAANLNLEIEALRTLCE